MAKFKFKLETVLKVKLRVEELRQRELKLAEAKREKASRELERRENQLRENVQLFRERFQAKIDPRAANEFHQFLNWLNQQVDQALFYLAECEKEVAARREILVEASKERKVLEKLKEQAYQEYLAEQQRQDINFLDELGTGRFNRRNDAEEEVHK